MGKTIRIEVTAEDIAAGKPDKCRECPIALAAIRAGIPEANVKKRCIFVAPTVRVLLPDAAQRFIDDFDEFREVEPFSFDLELP